MAKVKSGKADYFAAGQTFVLRVGDGNTPNATGAFTWVPFTDANGAALPGALTITDPNGVTSVDARNTTNLAAFKGTDYQRPEDMQIQTLDGREYLYVTTTTTHEVYRLDLQRTRRSRSSPISNTIDLATGSPVGLGAGEPRQPRGRPRRQHLHRRGSQRRRGRRHLVAEDLNEDGDLNDAGEGIGRWASNGTAGIGVHRPLLRSDRQAPRVGEHPAPVERQRPNDRDHGFRSGRGPLRIGHTGALLPRRCVRL